MSDQNQNEEYEILPEDTQNFDLSFKIIVIGDSGVGKSCLTMKATKNYFENYYSPTVGFEFFTFFIKIKEKCIRLQIWDTCGQEVYRSLITGFYRNSSVALLVYAIDNKQSFDNMEKWLNDVKSLGNPNVKIFMIGNKVDLDAKRQITKEQGKKFCQEHGLDMFFETSAKTGFNVQKVFVEVANLLYEENLKYQERANNLSKSTVSIDFGPDNPNLLNIDDDENYNYKKKKCCI
jgi:Ras-related protein Rab-2A